MIVENKLRVQLFIQTLTLLLSNGLAVTKNLSNLHLTHVALQPMILFVTIHLSETWTHAVALVAGAATVLDGLAFSTSLTIVQRCTNNLTPSCVTRTRDELPWLLVSAIHTFVSLLQTLNLLRFRSSRNVDQSKRIQLITWFLFVQDSAWLIVTTLTGIEWAVLIHPVVNLLLFWLSQTKDPTKLFTMLLVTGLLFALDTYLFAIKWNTVGFHNEVLQLFLVLYAITDLILFYCCYAAMQTLKPIKGSKLPTKSDASNKTS